MKLFLYSLFSISLLSLASCKKECEFWMEGKKCDSEVRLNYYGAYVGDYDEGFPSDVTNTFTEYPNDPKRMLLDEAAAGILYVVLTSNTEFIIPFQETTTPLFGTTQWEGTGSFDGNTVSYSLSRTGSGASTYMGSK